MSDAITALPAQMWNFLESIHLLKGLRYYLHIIFIVSKVAVLANVYASNVTHFQCPLDPLTERYPDPTDSTCKNFFLCHRGHAFPRICNVRTAFHPKLRQCYPRSQIPEQLCSQPIECDYNGFKEDPKDCTKYYICFYRQAVHFSCEHHYIFDNAKQLCVKNKEKARICTEPKPHPGPDPRTLAVQSQNDNNPLIFTAY